MSTDTKTVESFLEEFVGPIKSLQIYDRHDFDGPELTIYLDVSNAFIHYQLCFTVEGDDLKVTFTAFNHEECGFNNEAYDNTWAMARFPMSDPELSEKVLQKIKDVFIPIVQGFLEDFEEQAKDSREVLAKMRRDPKAPKWSKGI